MVECPVCHSVVADDCNFCPICGTRLAHAPPTSYAPWPEGGTATTTTPGDLEAGQRKSSGIRVAAAIFVVVLLLVASVFVLLPLVSQINSRSSNFQPTGTPPACPSVPASSTVVSAPTPNYDLQEVMVFAQSYNQLEFNVTAVAQCDASGYGPAYLLNGLSNTGYWYQVGINWNWPLQQGGYTPGFGFVSEAWAPGGLTRSPPSVAFSGPVNQGDTIELSLSFLGDQVVASATDLSTGASGSMSYFTNGGTTFVGSQAQQSQPRFSFATQGYFTGLMTEWYHVNASGNPAPQKVTYSGSQTPVGSATLGVGEWNFTGSVQSSVFSNVANLGNPIDLGSQPNQLQQFNLGGYIVSADAYEFVTGT